MEATEAISLVAEWMLWRNLDYPTEGLVADRFEAGWSVYAPVSVDEVDPAAFLDMPVGRSVFLVGDSGRIQEVSSSIPPQRAHADFTARELAAQPFIGVGDDRDFEADYYKRRFRRDNHKVGSAPSGFITVDAAAGDVDAQALSDDGAIEAQDPTATCQSAIRQLGEGKTMDPRRIELSRRHSREMGALLVRYLGTHPDVESEVDGAQMTAAQDVAWTAYSAELLTRQRAERSALAAEIEAERRR